MKGGDSAMTSGTRKGDEDSKEIQVSEGPVSCLLKVSTKPLQEQKHCDYKKVKTGENKKNKHVFPLGVLEGSANT